MNRKYLVPAKIGLVFAGIVLIFSVKTWAGTLIPISSATYDGGSIDWAYGVATDGNNNIIVTGRSYNGANNDYLTIKYDSNLVVISSVAYDGGNNDAAQGVTTDGNNNVIVTGESWNVVNNDYLTIKHDSNLVIISSVAYDGGSIDVALGVTTDGNNNIIVTGRSYGANYDYYTIKYDNNLVVISSVAYDAGSTDVAWGVTTDGNDNIIVTGISYNGASDDYVTIKYDNNLVVISSSTYDGGNSDYAIGVSIDGNNNIIVTGYSYIGANYDCFTIKYLGFPQIFSLSPSFASPGETLDIVVNGLNFYNGANMVFSGTGITINYVDFINDTQLRVNITIDDNAFSGTSDITITNIDEASGVLQSGFEIRENISYQEEENSRFIEVSPKIITPNGDGINDVANFIFSNPNNETVEGMMFDLSGSVVKDNLASSSTTSLIWDGQDNGGCIVSGKVYIYQIKVGGKVFNGTVVVAK